MPGASIRLVSFQLHKVRKLPMPRVTFHTLGCKLNFAETSGIRRRFANRGYVVVPFGHVADVVVINTCSVTSEADRKCRQVIRRGRKTSPEACLIVTGCYAQLRPEAVAAIEGVDVVLGTREKARLFEFVDSFERRDEAQVNVSCTDDLQDFDPALLSFERTRAFLKVQDGCDYSCAFCTIPRARGGSRSASPNQVVEQARAIAVRGIQEIVLTGVNIGLYGQGRHDGAGGNGTLLRLLEDLSRVEGIARFRISSIEPNLLSDDIIDFVGRTPSFVPHFHLPLQSGDDTMLGIMRRRYRRSVYVSRVERIRQAMPDAGIGADVIVGHPGECSERFQTTVRFLRDLPVTYLHTFTYSERPDTVSATTTRHRSVPVPERRARNRTLRTLSDRKLAAFVDSQVGTIRPVLWERGRKRDLMRGYTDNYIQVQRPFDAQRAGQVEHVRLRRREGLTVVAG